MSHIIKLLVITIVCFCSITVNAATFPPIIDTRVSPVDIIETATPEVILPDGFYTDLFEIEDIDNDGIRDHVFQIYNYDYLYGDISTDGDGTGAELCPSVYIAASSVVGSSFVPSDAVEIIGLETLYQVDYSSYGCLSYYGLQPTVIPDLNNDQLSELIFHGDYFYFEADAETSSATVLFGTIEKGAVIDVNKAQEGDGGFALAPNLYFQNSLGDLNGDGFADLLIVDYHEGNYDEYFQPVFQVVSGAALTSVSRLSIDTLSAENILVSFDSPELSNVTGGGDFNGDSFDDVILSVYKDGVGYVSYVLYGASDLEVTVQISDLDTALFRLNVCERSCELSVAGDFNADGFDDVVLSNYDVDGGVGSGGLIFYGSSAGLPASVDSSNSTTFHYSDSSRSSYFYSTSVGDINGDGASDLFFVDYDGFNFVLLGDNVSNPSDIVVDQLNGENGFQIISPDDSWYFYSVLKDINNDGFDDIVGEYGNSVILYGRPESDKPLGVQGLSVATGQTMTYLSWRAPDSSAGQIEIYVNDNLIDSVDTGTTYYQFSEPAPDSTAVLTLQYVNSESETSPALKVPLSNSFQALRQLRATVYSGNALELFWDSEPSDYIVWRNGSVLAQITGNSYVDSDVEPGVEYRYHVTQGANASGLELGRSTTLPEIGVFSDCFDYCEDYYDYSHYDYYYYDECRYIGAIDDRPAGYRSLYPASTDQLLVTTETTGVEFSTPAVERVDTCPTFSDFRTNSAGYQMYSTTAVELFWERATHISGVVSYEVSLFDEVLNTIDATSYFIEDIGSETYYEYKVTAIAGDGSRSIPSIYSIYLPENDQEYIDFLNQPPPAVDVRAEVYSSTAAELFWQMQYDNVGNALTYQVSRNGEIVVATDAQSYFDDSLMPATTYTYELVALSSAGVFSDESTFIEISTPSDGAGAGSDGAESVLPTGARGIVYSNNALELFWDRSPDSTISSYLIYRNAQLLGQTDGNTFYDSGLNPDTEYRYSVQASDKDGGLIGNAALVLLRTIR